MNTQTCTSALVQFRHRLYQNFTNRADTLMELVDALSSNGSTRSVVELCLTPCFRRTYSTLYKALAEWNWDERQLALAGTRSATSKRALVLVIRRGRHPATASLRPDLTGS